MRLSPPTPSENELNSPPTPQDHYEENHHHLDLLQLHPHFLVLMANIPPNDSNGHLPGINDQQSSEILYSIMKRQVEGQEAAQTSRSSKKQRTGEDEKEAAAAPQPVSLPAAESHAHHRHQNLVAPVGVGQGRLNGTGDAHPHAFASTLFLNDQYMRAELQAMRLQQEAAANRNAALMVSLLGHSHTQGQPMTYPSLQQHLALQGGQGAANALGGATVDNFFSILMNRSQSTANQGMPSNSLNQQLQPHVHMFGGASLDVNAMLRHLSWPQPGVESPHQALDGASRASAGAPTARPTQRQASEGTLRLPPCEDGSIPSYAEREKFTLGVEEDPNWLSEFHCFVRSELVEICRASREDCKSRNNATSFQQVGLRCVFCAHRPPTARGCRSSAYPSSIRQIYQSFTMMLRDHFGACESMPNDIKQRFLTLKDKPSQGATDSKRYWMYSAMKAGLADSPDGIIMNHSTLLAGRAAPPFGSDDPLGWQEEASNSSPLIAPNDAPLGNAFIRYLLAQAQVIQLRKSEQIGNRRSLEHGLPGFSCRSCWEKRRLGLCRMFPARRRTLLQKLLDLHEHMRRCQATPIAVKEELDRLRAEVPDMADTGEMKLLLDLVWIRLGHRG